MSTNSIESVWAVMKRSLHGVYHQASNKHLHRYVNEFTFRLNDGNVAPHAGSAGKLRRCDGRAAHHLQGADPVKGVPPALDRIADVVLAYRPAAKQKRKNVSRRRKTKSKGRK